MQYSGGGGISGHTLFDIYGLIPGIGELADAINAVWYAAEGDYVNAGLSGGATIPLAGWIAAGAKLALKTESRALSKVDSLPCNCFVAKTKVQTSTGAKAIEDVRPGDRVWAKSLTTGKDELRPVTGLFQKESMTLMTITVATGAKVVVTQEHPFMVDGEGWVLSGDLRVGDRLTQRNGGVATIATLDIRPSRQTVYNFEVAGDHNYYITDSQLLVHNCPVLPKDFIPPTNPASHPPAELPDGFAVRSMPANSQYPNGYWRLTNAQGQYLDPSTMKPPSNVSKEMSRAMTHVEYPAP
ncbi:MAG: polymorphic toxin-type HINT domain-containing protein [Nocardioides sp.]